MVGACGGSGKEVVVVVVRVCDVVIVAGRARIAQVVYVAAGVLRLVLLGFSFFVRNGMSRSGKSAPSIAVASPANSPENKGSNGKKM